MKLTIKADLYSSAGTAADIDLELIVIPSATLLPNQCKRFVATQCLARWLMLYELCSLSQYQHDPVS